jgi:hypothetical protein
VDAHSRGRAEEIDAAGRWVLDPQTGNDELRLNHSGTESQGSSLPPDSRSVFGHDSGEPRARLAARRSRRAARDGRRAARDGRAGRTTSAYAPDQTDQAHALADVLGLPRRRAEADRQKASAGKAVCAQ